MPATGPFDLHLPAGARSRRPRRAVLRAVPRPRLRSDEACRSRHLRTPSSSRRSRRSRSPLVARDVAPAGQAPISPPWSHLARVGRRRDLAPLARHRCSTSRTSHEMLSSPTVTPSSPHRSTGAPASAGRSPSPRRPSAPTWRLPRRRHHLLNAGTNRSRCRGSGGVRPPERRPWTKPSSDTSRAAQSTTRSSRCTSSRRNSAGRSVVRWPSMRGQVGGVVADQPARDTAPRRGRRDRPARRSRTRR